MKSHVILSIYSSFHYTAISFGFFVKFLELLFADFGPYTLDFSLSGRYMIAAGRKGHMALMDMKNMDLIKELQVL